MEPAGPAPSRKRPSTAAGALVVENGNQAGMRRPLNTPLSFVGQAQGCDVRLKGAGIEPLHCLLAHGPNGLQLRDLNSAAGTLVNGKRVSSVVLHDGDVVTVGGCQLRLCLPEGSPATNAEFPSSPAIPDALRVQAAAVAAQQTALTEEEGRLQQRVAALENQEEQLSAHLEEKRRLLVKLHDKTQAERSALQNERTSYEQYVDRVTGDLTQAQRELIDKQQQVQAERRRLGDLQRRLKQRWQRHGAAQKKEMLVRHEELANEEANLATERDHLRQQEQALQQDRLQFNGQYEVGRRQLLHAWAKLRQAQARWRQRRRQERAALCVRARGVEETEVVLAGTRRLLEKEQSDWNLRRQLLEQELEGLNNRVRHQRDKIFEQQQELQRLDAQLRERKLQAAPLPAADGSVATESTVSEVAVQQPAENAVAPVAEPWCRDDTTWHRRLADLERVAGDLADQRLQLTEQWELLAKTQERWQEERDRAVAQLEAVGVNLQEQEHALTARQQACEVTEQALAKKHRELVQLKQHVVGWRARLRAQETSWEAERNRVLGEVKQREKLVEHHLNELLEIRRRWAHQRRQEVDKLKTERAACETSRREYAVLRSEWQRRCAALDDDKRQLTEKSLALEQYRQEVFAHSGDPDAERRLEHLRRRWLTQNAASLRALTRDRQELDSELAALEARFGDLQKRADEVAAAGALLAEKQTAWEHKKTHVVARHAQIKRELLIARDQRAGTEKELARMKEEVERIAHELMDEPDPPSLPVGQAA